MTNQFQDLSINVQSMIQNAKTASAVLDGLRQSKEYNPFFERCFHIRPTESGFTVVSTLPYAPMRGESVKTADELAELVTALHDKIRRLMTAGDTASALDILKEAGFPRRKHENEREENAQAAFIRGMIAGEDAYEGIRFVASELTIDGKNRFDVVGLKDDALYIFELKKDRSTSAFPQARRYLEHIEEHWDLFSRLLANYPGCGPIAYSRVISYVVLPWAANSPTEQWKDLAAKEGVGTWFFRPALAFEKLEP